MKRATEILPCESSDSLPGAAFFLLQVRSTAMRGYRRLRMVEKVRGRAGVRASGAALDGISATVLR